MLPDFMRGALMVANWEPPYDEDDDFPTDRRQRRRRGRQHSYMAEHSNDADYPACKCGKTATLQTVRKENANKDRQFWCCYKPMSEDNRCNFFQWADGNPSNVASTSPAPSAPSAPSTPSKPRAKRGGSNLEHGDRPGNGFAIRERDQARAARLARISRSGRQEIEDGDISWSDSDREENKAEPEDKFTTPTKQQRTADYLPTPPSTKRKRSVSPFSEDAKGEGKELLLSLSRYVERLERRLAAEVQAKESLRGMLAEAKQAQGKAEKRVKLLESELEMLTG